MLEEEPAGQCEMAALRLPVLLLYGGLQSVAGHMSQQKNTKIHPEIVRMGKQQIISQAGPALETQQEKM